MKLILIALIAMGLSSCGQRGSQVEYHADGGQTLKLADKPNGDLTAQIGGSVAMPTDLPSWAPAYPGSKVEIAQTKTAATAQGALENVMLSTSDNLATVSAFYDRQIDKAGAKSMHSVTTADVTTRMVDTPSGIVSVAVSKNDDATSTISITRMAK